MPPAILSIFFTRTASGISLLHKKDELRQKELFIALSVRFTSLVGDRRLGWCFFQRPRTRKLFCFRYIRVVLASEAAYVSESVMFFCEVGSPDTLVYIRPHPRACVEMRRSR